MTDLAQWRRAPLKVVLWDPMAGKAAKTYTFVGTVPSNVLSDLRKGGGDHAADYYGKSTVKSIRGTEIVTDVEVFPEDNFLTLKEKIFLATGIPIYRQHLYDPEDGWIPYSLWTDRNNTIDIDAIADGAIKMSGVYVDKQLYERRAQIRIESRDTFILLRLRSSRLYRVVDLATFTRPVHSQLQAVVADNYLYGLVYWGFIAKYWPMLTQEAFSLYVRNEPQMQIAYPDLSPMRADLAPRYADERKIVLQKYTNLIRAKPLAFAITQFTAAVISVSVKLNIRNIFEQMRVSEDIPEIRAWTTIDTDRVMVQRQEINAPMIDFPALELFRKGITYALRLRGDASPHYLWLCIHPNGKYYMRSTYREEDGVDFAGIYDVLNKHVRPVINTINTMGRMAFVFGSKLESLHADKVIYQGLNVAMSWRQTVTLPAFSLVRDKWERYIAAGIVALKSTTTADRIDVSFRKGIYEYDPEQIDRVLSISLDVDNRNQYSYLTNPAIHAKWLQSYGGRLTTMTLRDTDVRIDVSDIREDEFNTFRDYIRVFLWQISQLPEFTKLLNTVEHGTDRRLRRLREQDPSLYNLGRHGSDRNYSKICQGVRQPTIFDKGEFDRLSARERGALVQYWNFTKNEPAWYGCPDKVHTHLGFIVGVHPAGWCMPCCNKKLKQNEVQKTCLQDRTFGVETAGSRHVMVYGKEVPLERLSQIKSAYKPRH